MSKTRREFISKPKTLDDILDQKRIEAITPFLIFYGLQDLIPNIKTQLIKIRERDKCEENTVKYIINKWEVKFDKSFVGLSSDTKLIFINNIQKLDKDFDKMIKKRIKQYKRYTPNSNPLYFGKMKMNGFDMSYEIITFCDDIMYRMSDRVSYLHLGDYYVDWSQVL